MTRTSRKLLFFFLAVLLTGPGSLLHGQTAAVEITRKPRQLLHGIVAIPVTSRADVSRVQLLVNDVPAGEQRGRLVVFNLPLGLYIRRLRIRAVGYDAQNQIIGEDEMVINDPKPPFRLRLFAPSELPKSAMADISAVVTAPGEIRVEGVEFFAGEKSLGVDSIPPYVVSFDPVSHGEVTYVRAVARATGGLEANDVHFWGSAPGSEVEVSLQQIPLSVSDPRLGNTLKVTDLQLSDNGRPRKIESLIRANDQPLNVVLLLDSSESMLEELPLLKQAAKQFAASLIRPADRIAVVGFHQKLFWLTPFTSNLNLVNAGVDRLRPLGQTHLYDSVIEMLFELQKMPGRRALIVFSDGVNQGGAFNLDHLVHYARYSGVPVYPIIKNSLLSKLMRFGIPGIQAKKFAQIARDSGATYFIIQNPAELPRVYTRIAEELKQQQLITFHTEMTGVDQWHALGLTSSRGKPGTFRIPRGYFP